MGGGDGCRRSPLTETPETDPETPYMIIYTSGTTGRPKGAVHVHGGFPIKGAQDLAHCFDLGHGRPAVLVHRPGLDDGPVGDLRSLLLRRRAWSSTKVRPTIPAPDRLWAIVARHGVTHLGLSPTVIRALMAHGTDPVRAHDLSSCASSARPASRGTRSPGGGSSARSAAAGCRSSTTAAAPR